MAESISCKKFTDFLIRRAEHFDSEIIRDVTPTDGWIGHVSTGTWEAGSGVVHQFDKIHRVYPDLSGAWQDVTAGNCIGTPCDPTEQKIGFGYTQEDYKLQTKSYGTDLFCFDLIMSADRAKEQFAALISSLKDATNIIVSDRYRNEALRIAKRKILLTTGLPAFTYTSSADGMTITPSALPTSEQTIEALQRFIQPLILEGALGTVPDMPPIFEYVTDLETAWALREGKSDLTNKFMFTDFVRGGALYKYGITDAIGNFGIRIDPYPIRYLINGADLVRVMPYTNVAASGGVGGAGIRGEVQQKYIDAPVQLDFIWNRMAMRSDVRQTEEVNSMMPFAKRGFGGQWTFALDNLGADASGCVIENARRNKGKFFSDFAFGTKALRPEWVVAFLTLRDRSAYVVVAPSFTAATYSAQDYTSDNDVCSFTVDITQGTTYPKTVVAGSITCNGVNVAHSDSGSLANQAALLAFLNSELAELGTWSAVNATTLRLVGTVCSSVTIPGIAT